MADREFEKKIEVMRAAFDKRDPDPKKDYGIGGVTLRFSLVGPQGAISWAILTDWYLPHVRDEFRAKGWMDRGPTGGPVTIHSSKQMFEHDNDYDECDLLPEGKCYCDVGYLAGDEAFARLIEKGDEGLWEFLEGFYDSMLLQVNELETERTKA